MDWTYLKPGETFFGPGPGDVRTLLGSCVAVTLWHPRRRLGGMCHFVLPERARGAADLDGRYGDEALLLLEQAMTRAGTLPREYQAGVFGGGNMFPNFNTVNGARVGDQNIERARVLVRRYGFRLVQEDVGGYAYRHVTLDLNAGTVSLRRTEVAGGHAG